MRVSAIFVIIVLGEASEMPHEKVLYTMSKINNDSIAKKVNQSLNSEVA